MECYDYKYKSVLLRLHMNTVNKMMHNLLVLSVLVVTLLLRLWVVNGWITLYESSYKQSFRLFQDNIVVVGIYPNELKETAISDLLLPPIKSSTSTTINESSNGNYGGKYGGAWMKQYYELLQFYKQYNHTIVPKRYKDNTSLGNWVNKQRQQYRNYIYKLKPCSLTIQRINLLNNINFVWNATSVSLSHSRQQSQQKIVSKMFTSTPIVINNKATNLNDGTEEEEEEEEEWWNQYNQLKSLLQTLQVVSLNTTQLDDNSIIQYRPIHYVHRYNNTLAHWLDKQRDAYNNNNNNNHHNHAATATDVLPVVLQLLSNDKIRALQQLDLYWYMSCRDYIWEKRFIELQQYKTMYGDCCVPINYINNKQLGQWVSNQRKLLKKYCTTGTCTSTTSSSSLSYNRFEQLHSIGFVWNRWEYEFTKKQIKL